MMSSSWMSTIEIFVLLTFWRSSNAQTRTDFIQALLVDYDSRIPPNFDKNNATEVDVSLYINNIDSISEQAMDFTVNAVIQQEWEDSRLQFYGLIPAEYLELDAKLMEHVWVPDLYIANEKRASFHSITVPNRMMHLHSNGRIKYRLRVSITASCPMILHKYPLDHQTCSLIFQSFAYSVHSLQFNWRGKDAIVVKTDAELPQFSVQSYQTHKCTDTEGNFTCIRLDITLKRNIGFYMIQIYIPTVLIVLLSWVSFWLSIDAVPARISLGILTVLTMTTQKTSAISSLPRVSYVKAIDVWMAACLIFVFAALLEYAIVNVLQRREALSAAFNQSEYITVGISDTEKGHTNHVNHTPETAKNRRARYIDELSRVVFPLVFLLFCITYWVAYVH